MENILELLPDSPIVGFTILLLVILFVPPIFEKLKLPGLVGLLVAGVCLGPDGLGLLNAESDTMKLLSDIGKIYLMFVAGLEIDLEEFRKTKDRSLSFGVLTFLIPLGMGTMVGLAFGMGLNASILIGSLLASHTLLGYPIVNRLGVVNNEAVTVTVGATIFTDIAALLVLAICVSIHGGDFSAASLVIQLGSLAIYSAIVLFGFDWAGKEYFRRTGDEESNQFLFILLAVFLASVGAQIINVDKIVGAFLAGLAVNDVVGRSPVEDKIEFVGSTLFIPFFFVGMGLLLNVSSMISTLTIPSQLVLTVAIVGVLFVSKFLAAFFIKFIYAYNWNQTLTMWSLSLPQVAATLAAAVAGFNAGLIEESILNIVIVLMLVTAVSGPILTTRFARKLKTTTPQPDDGGLEFNKEAIRKVNSHRPFTVLVPICNPHTQRYLVEMGSLLAHHEKGIVVPLSITKAHVHMDEPQLDQGIEISERLLEKAKEVASQFEVQVETLTRIDDDVTHGISRSAKEKEASLIVMGWSPTNSIQARLFGNTIDNVFWSSHCPVAVMRLLEEPINIHKILVPMKNISPQTLETVRFAMLFADTHQSQVTLLHIKDRKASKDELYSFEENLKKALETIQPKVEFDLKLMRHDNASEAIVHTARNFELVVLRSIRRRTAGGLAVSDITTRVIEEISCSVVLFGEPNSMYQ